MVRCTHGYAPDQLLGAGSGLGDAMCATQQGRTQHSDEWKWSPEKCCNFLRFRLGSPIFFCFFPKHDCNVSLLLGPFFALPPAVQVWAGSGSHVSAHEICTIDRSPVASNNSHFSRASVRQSDDCFVEWRMPISISWLTKCAFTVVLCGDAANVENMNEDDDTSWWYPCFW